jgi:hypothetical protein
MLRGETYSVPGTYIFTVPDGVSSIFVECVGGGGAGGSMNKTAVSNFSCGGGGGGAYAGSTISVVPGATYSIKVGSGVAPSTSAFFPGKGGSSSFTQLTTDLVVADSGSSANLLTNPAAPTNGGQKGFALYSIGDIKYDGGYGNGASQDAPTYDGGGGGGAGGRGGAGNPTIINGTRDYLGGTGSFPGGNGGNSGFYPANSPFKAGSPGNPYGGGGGGAFSTAITTLIGGTGSNGVVLLTYTSYKQTCLFQLIT